MKRLDFLWEVGCEEIPADWLPDLLAELRHRVATGLEGAGLGNVSVETYGTLRRLVVYVPRLAEKQPDREEEMTGPPERIAHGPDGGWSKAALGFAKKHEIDPSQLVVLETAKGRYVGFVRKLKGQRTAKLLPGLMAATLRSLSFPKFMSWDAEIPDGKGAFTFGRPIRWMVALLGTRVVPFTIHVGHETVRAAAKTRGHRFLAPKGEKPGRPFTVSSFRDYEQKLRRHYVLVDPDARTEKLERQIRQLEQKAGARRGTSARGLTTRLLADLVEWPGAVLGRYPEEFSSLPEDVRQTVLVHHQKYLPLEATSAFIAVTNTASDPKGFIRKGSERVVVARLRDGRFFWDEDLKRPLADRREALSGVVFHERLGSYERKIERLMPLSRRLAHRCRVDVDTVERAAELAKCDLTTGMVSEFPELQGIMGGLYAKAQGEPEAVWKAVYSHYRPSGLGAEEDFPLSAEGVVVSLADKLDTLAAMFSVGVVPTGSRDPFGLRRAALGIVRMLLEAEQRLGLVMDVTLRELLHEALQGVERQLGKPTDPKAIEALEDFLTERLRFVFQRSFRYDEVNAVFALGTLEGAPLELVRRLEAVRSLRGSDDFEALSVAFKRVRNILSGLSGQSPGAVDPEALIEPEERQLWTRFRQLEPEAERRFQAGDYRGALRTLSRLRPEVDTFFDKVLVMAEDPGLRANRLALLTTLNAALTQVADLSEIVADPKAGSKRPH